MNGFSIGIYLVKLIPNEWDFESTLCSKRTTPLLDSSRFGDFAAEFRNKSSFKLIYNYNATKLCLEQTICFPAMTSAFSIGNSIAITM
eukprot:Pgem_evm1s14079